MSRSVVSDEEGGGEAGAGAAGEIEVEVSLALAVGFSVLAPVAGGGGERVG